jgi:hypothetical protein
MKTGVTATPGRSKVIETFSVFATGASGWLAALIYFEMAPKNGSESDTLRLIYTCGFFFAIIGFLLHSKRTLPYFLSTLNRWRYEDAPPTMESAWKNLIEEFEFILKSLVWILVLLTSTTGIAVLSCWFCLPGILLGFNAIAWWIAVSALVAFGYWLPASLNSIYKHYRFLRRQIATCDFYQPKSISDLWSLAERAPDRKFKLLAPKDGFIAGNRPWTFQALTQNLIAFGSIGSGKTACVMNALLDQFVASTKVRKRGYSVGGLVLDFKGDYLDKLRLLCTKHSRDKDLVILSSGGHHRWNPLDSDEPANEIAARFVSAMKAFGQKDRNTTFFADQAESFVEHAITLLRCTGGPEHPPSIADIHRIANDWEYTSLLLDQAQQDGDFVDRADPVVRSQLFFRNEFVSLPDETRNSVIGTLNNMLNPLCARNVASLIDGPSTITLKDVASNSKILYLDLPQAKAPKAGRILGLLLKLSFFAEVRRKELRSGRYSFFFADEFQEFFTSDHESSDTRFFAVSREFDHCNIVATQNINNFTMQGDKKDAVMSLLGNIKTKIFLQNSDQQTNAYASELFGRHVEEFGGGHIGAHAHVVPNLSPGDFVKLRTPERGKCDYCDSYMLIESGSRVDVANRANRWPIVSI